MRSIRRRVVWTLVLGQAALLGALDLGAWTFGNRWLTETFDAQLDEKVRTLATLVRQSGPYVELEYAEDLMPAYAREEDPEYFQVWITGAGVLERSETLEVLGDVQLAEPEGETDVVVHADLVLPDGRSGRGATFVRAVHEYEPVAEDGKEARQRQAGVAVAVARTPLDARLARLGWTLGLGSFALVALSAWLVRLLLAEGLRPIDTFAQRVAEVERPSDGPRAALAALQSPAEVAPIAASVDRMLERLDQAFARERRLSNDIAHELRTPLAELRTAMDVALMAPDDSSGLQRAVETARDISDEMESTVSALMRLARAQRASAEALGTADLAAVLCSSVAAARATAEARGVELDVEACAQLAPEGRAIECAVAERPLALVIGNLVQNAASHAAAGTRIDWGLEVDADGARLQIANDCAAEVDPARLSEAFYTTGDSADHSGLGLAIVRALCDASGIELGLDVSSGRFTARLALPIAQREPGSMEAIPPSNLVPPRA